MEDQALGFFQGNDHSAKLQQNLLDLLAMAKSQLTLIKDCGELEEEAIAAFELLTEKRQEKLEQIRIEYDQDKAGNSAELVIGKIIAEIQAIDEEINRILQEKLNDLGQKIGRIASNRKANNAYDGGGAIRSIFVDQWS